MSARWIVISALEERRSSAAYAHELACALGRQQAVLFWDIESHFLSTAKTLAQIYPFRESFSTPLLRNYLKEEPHRISTLRGPSNEQTSGLFAWIKSCFDFSVIAAPANWSSDFITLLDFSDGLGLIPEMACAEDPAWSRHLDQLAKHRFSRDLIHLIKEPPRILAQRLLEETDFFAKPALASADLREKAKNRIHARLLEVHPGSAVLPEESTQTLLEKLIAEEPALPSSREVRGEVLDELMHNVLGLGPLEPLLKDPQISEIMVNGPCCIFVEKAGQLYESPAHFDNEEQLRGVIDRIVAPLGRRVDESTPLCDARLANGSRVNIVLPPLALNGPVLTIRKFMQRRPTLKDLIEFKALNSEMGEFLVRCVQARKNILVSGGTGSGKTTLLNILSGCIAAHERIVTIEDAAELKLQQPHVVRLESRPPNAEGQGAISIRQLVMNALRMRPDRIIVGECRGGEALDMLQAMNTGHDGSLTTLHANSPRDALGRLEALVLMAGIDLPIRVIREQIRSAVHLVVQVARLAEGQRKIIAITELTGMEGDVLTTAELFRYRHGQFENTGLVSQMRF